MHGSNPARWCSCFHNCVSQGDISSLEQEVLMAAKVPDGKNVSRAQLEVGGGGSWGAACPIISLCKKVCCVNLNADSFWFSPGLLRCGLESSESWVVPGWGGRRSAPSEAYRLLWGVYSQTETKQLMWNQTPKDSRIIASCRITALLCYQFAS